MDGLLDNEENNKIAIKLEEYFRTEMFDLPEAILQVPHYRVNRFNIHIDGFMPIWFINNPKLEMGDHRLYSITDVTFCNGFVELTLTSITLLKNENTDDYENDIKIWRD